MQALRQSDFQVDWVNDGRLVASSLKASRYDALILDLGLPGRDGHDVLDGLRDAGHGLPVLILTARDSLMERVHTLKAGADDFLAKPFELAELEARLLALVRRARRRTPALCLRAPGVRPRGPATAAAPPAAQAHPARTCAAAHPRCSTAVSPCPRDLLERVFADEIDASRSHGSAGAPAAQTPGRQRRAHQHPARPGLCAEPDSATPPPAP